MQFSRLLPKRFSTRLIAITIISGLIPIIIFGYLINIFDNRFLTQINYAVYQGQEEQWQRSEAVMRKMAEDFIRQKVLDVVALLTGILLSGTSETTTITGLKIIRPFLSSFLRS